MIKFELSEIEEESFKNLKIEHKKECEIHYCGAIGGRYSFIFTRTGIGDCVSVRCVCGFEKNITDYSNW